MNAYPVDDPYQKCEKCGYEEWGWRESRCPTCGYNGYCDHPNMESGIKYDYCPDCGYSRGYI